jgi:carbohydrate kinase (thermoresistant glucokinase family)
MGIESSAIYFVMGVSGCGKSTIGGLLAQRLDLPFYDGDDFHPEANIKKMSSGEPLTDIDRHDWLVSLNKLAAENEPKGAVIACSALKNSYRDILAADLQSPVHWILLEGTFQEIFHRLEARKGHFMPQGLLQSQFDTLEIPEGAISVSINKEPEHIVSTIIELISRV